MKTAIAPRRAYALSELAALLVLAAVLAALLTLAAHDHRRLGRLGEDIGKLRRIGALTGQYAADNADQFWTFSWRKGQALSKYPDLNTAPDDNQAAANQAVDFLLRNGRTDIFYISFWHPNRMYSQFALEDSYASLADPVFISAADRHRLKWSRDPQGFDNGLYAPFPSSPAPPNNNAKRWPYSASFHLGSGFYDKSDVSSRVYQGSWHASYQISASSVLGPRLLSEVEYPAHKVHLNDSNARHFGAAQPFATHDQARLPLLFVDASVTVRAASESNAGWTPPQPTSQLGLLFYYQPDVWEPLAWTPGVGGDLVMGRFLWTRGGVAGRDFGAPEVCTGQPGCP